MVLTAQGKFIDTKQIERLLTEGEKYSDVIYFSLPKINNSIDISDCTFTMRTVAATGEMTEGILTTTTDGDNIIASWYPSDAVTAVPGMLFLELIGSKGSERIIKYKMPAIYVKKSVMGEGLPVPDVIEEKLAQMNEVLAQAAEIQRESEALHEAAAELQKRAEELAELISGESSVTDEVIAAEVIAARKSAFSDNVFSSLSQRLLVDFNTRIGQSDLEEAIGNAIIQANASGVGRFWHDENGVRQGEIFDDYNNNIAYCKYAHAEGYGSCAGQSGAQTPGAHSEGYMTSATNAGTHAEGYGSHAHNPGAHAEGSYTCAALNDTHAEGCHTYAASEAQHVGGRYNVIDNQNKYVRIIGNGTSDDERSNALTLDWSGNLWTAGDMTATNVSGETVSLCGTAALTESALGMSRKNLLKNTVGTATQNGITFTHNSDGSVTCNGTATADTNYRYIAQLKPNTKYILSGCPSGGSTSVYNLFAMDADTWTKIYRDIGNGVTFDTGSCSTWHFIIRISSGQTVDGLTFFPMLRNAAVTNSDYEQYTEDLQTQINQIKSQLAALTAAVE